MTIKWDIWLLNPSLSTLHGQYFTAHLTLCNRVIPFLEVGGPHLKSINYLSYCFGELPNKFTLEDCPTYLYRRVAHNLNKYFCLETIFIHGINKSEGVGEDSRHGIGHVDIRVVIINSLECVCLPLHCN